MRENTRKQLESWPKPYIQSYALKRLIQKDGPSYYSLVERELKKGSLVKIKRGLYQIDQRMVSLFEIAHEIHSPSFISFESALSYHGWIPEAVYTTTSTCLRRSFEISTPLGYFSYATVPLKEFYRGVERVSKNEVFLIASPWRALADMVYSQKRSWKGQDELSEDLRIEREDLLESDFEVLEELAKFYPCKRVRVQLKRFLRG